MSEQKKKEQSERMKELAKKRKLDKVKTKQNKTNKQSPTMHHSLAHEANTFDHISN